MNQLEINETEVRTTKLIIEEIVNNLKNDVVPIKCSICIQELSKDEGKLECGHRFCYKCIKEWAKYTNACPNCNLEINKIKMYAENRFIKFIKLKNKRLSINSDMVNYNLL